MSYFNKHVKGGLANMVCVMYFFQCSLTKYTNLPFHEHSNHNKPHRWCNGERASLECNRLWVPDQVKPKTIQLRIKEKEQSKDWLAQNQDNVSEWCNMSTHELLFQ